MAEILKHTRSICSACGEIIPATYEVRAHERVFFSRTCPAHGTVDKPYPVRFSEGLQALRREVMQATNGTVGE